jgi:predicted RNA-binding protein with PIN domain
MPKLGAPIEVEYLLIDGYNIIYAWKPLKKIAAYSLDSAREKIIAQMQNYRAFKSVPGRRFEVIIVFDAHHRPGPGELYRTGGITVVFTKEAETADTYIERSSRVLVREYAVTVATSDTIEQIIIIGGGAKRICAEDFNKDVTESEKQMRNTIDSINPIKNNQLLDNLDEATAAVLEKLRQGLK